MKNAQHDFDKLHQLSKEIALFDGIAHHLDWDRETYMPSQANEIRSKQLEALAGLSHQKRTGRPFKNALAKLIDIESGELLSHAHSLSDRQQAALRRWRHDFIKMTKLPEKFVRTMAQVSSQAIMVWSVAKKEDAFHTFAPYLDKLISLARQKTDFVGYEDHPYDALLDDYEEGATTKEIAVLFKKLQPAITNLVTQMQKQKVDDSFLYGNFSEEKQMEISRELLNAIGFDFERGRLDTSSHPFSSSSHPTDSRITTRIDPHACFSSISSTLHEAGHSFYEMGLPTKDYGSPLCQAISLGAHESQSRWWENLIGRSRPFWHYFFPLLQKKFKTQLSHISLDSFYKAINRVVPSLIRVEADEVTYGLHIILRFELERALIEGSLQIRDIPEAWNAKMQSYLGLTPPDNRQGCLQDIHWAMGGFGYFPTYTLGNLYASHLFLGFEKQCPDWQERVSQGEFAFIKTWLHDHVHQYGRQYDPKEILKKATGKKFSEEAYLNYLHTKYSPNTQRKSP